MQKHNPSHQGKPPRLHQIAQASKKVFFVFSGVRILAHAYARVGSTGKKSSNLSLKPLLFAAALVVGSVFGVLQQQRPVYAVNDYLNFQSRLLNADGSLVQDGNYHLRFKIYSGGDGDLGGGDETLEWTETRSTGNLVRVVNGYISVSLGEVNALSSVDFSSAPMWLSMEIGGFAGSAVWDGELDPFMQITSVPQALNSGGLGGRTADEFVQLDPGASAQTVASANTAININQTGAGDLIDLQVSGTTYLGVSNAGALTLGAYDCSGNANGGALTADASGNITCTDDDGGGAVGVTSLNGATGALSIAGASETGGVITIQNATAAQNGLLTNSAQTIAGVKTFNDNIRLGVANTTNGSLQLFNSSNAFSATLSAANQTTGNVSIVFPDTGADTTDTVCLQDVGNCFGSGSGSNLQAAYDAGNLISTTNSRDIAFTLTNTAIDANFNVNIATGSTGKFAVQDNGSDIIRIDSTGIDLLDVDVADFTGATVTFDAGEIIETEIAQDTLDDSEIQDNSLTAASLATDSVQADEIAANAVGASELSSTTVTSGAYGSASTVATFTVDADGRLTAAADTSIAIAGTQITSGTINALRLTGNYTGITGVGALGAGSIGTGFGAINNGASGITTTGALNGGNTDITGTLDVSGAIDGATTLTVGSADQFSIASDGDITGTNNSGVEINYTGDQSTNFYSDSNIILRVDSNNNDTNTQFVVRNSSNNNLFAAGENGNITLGNSTLQPSIILNDGTGNTATLETVGALGADVTYQFGAATAGTYEICTDEGNCTIAEADTLASVTGRGSSTTTLSTFTGGLTVTGTTNIGGGSGNTTNIGNAGGTLAVRGSSATNFVIDGVTVSAAEFNRLDGKDAALVDVNDAVSTAITGTGVLGAGSIGTGFGAINNGASGITTTGTVSGGAGSFNSGAIRINYNSPTYGVAIDASPSGGWARSYNFQDSSDTILGGFGGYGAIDGLNYLFIGDSHSGAEIKVDPSTGNTSIGFAGVTEGDDTLEIAAGGNLDLNGDLEVNDVAVITSAAVLQNVTANANILTTGTLPSGRISGSYTDLTGTGALGVGSIASGFGAINNGSSGITTTGALNGGNTNVAGTLDVSGILTASSTSAAVIGNGTTGSINLGDGTVTKTSGSGFNFNSSIVASNGSAAAPSFSFGSDTNTGVYRGGADILAFSTAGAQRVTIDASGDTGFGDPTPTNKVDIQGALRVGAGYNNIAAPANGAIFEGSVGIGDSSPDALFDVQGVAAADSTNQTVAIFSDTAIGCSGLVDTATSIDITANNMSTLLTSTRTGCNNGADFSISLTDGFGSLQEQFRIAENGAAEFAGTLEVGTLGTANNDVVLCRNSSGIIAGCNSTFLTSAGAVTSLNGATGALTVANATASSGTITINDAGAGVSGLLTAGTQTIGGSKTFNGGTTQVNSAAINLGNNATDVITIQGITEFRGASAFQAEGNLKLTRSDGTDRSSYINYYNDSGAGSYLQLAVSDGTLGGQVDALTAYGDGSVSILGGLTVDNGTGDQDALVLGSTTLQSNNNNDGVITLYGEQSGVVRSATINNSGTNLQISASTGVGIQLNSASGVSLTGSTNLFVGGNADIAGTLTVDSAGINVAGTVEVDASGAGNVDIRRGSTGTWSALLPTSGVWPTNGSDRAVGYIDIDATTAYTTTLEVGISGNWSVSASMGRVTKLLSFYFNGTALSLENSQVTEAFGNITANYRIGDPEVFGGKVRVPIYRLNTGATTAISVDVEVYSGSSTANRDTVLNNLGITDPVLAANTEQANILSINSDQVCLSNNNCGTVDGSGVTNTIPLFTGTSTLGNSLITQTASTDINIGGDLNVTDGAFNLSASATEGLRVITSGSNGWTNLGTTNTTTDILSLYNSGNTEVIQFEADGDVAIGAGTTALAALAVNQSGNIGSANNVAYDIGAGTIAAGSSIYSYGSICSGNTSGACIGNNGVVLGVDNNNAGVNIIDGGASFFDGGNLGVATTAPNEALEVGGSGRVFIGDGGGASRTGLLIDANEAGDYVRLDAYDYGGSTGLDLAIGTVGNGNVVIGSNATPNAKLEVIDTTEQFRLSYSPAIYAGFTVDSSGDLEIDPTGADTTLVGRLDIDNGAATSYPLQLTSSGETTSIGALNGSYTHYDTTASLGNYFYDRITANDGLGLNDTANTQLIINQPTATSQTSILFQSAGTSRYQVGSQGSASYDFFLYDSANARSILGYDQSANTVSLAGLANCDTIDTNASGVLSCGVDGAGTSQFTDGGAFTYLTNTAEDLVIGGTTTTNADILLRAAGGSIFNQNNTNSDFRVEGVGENDTLYVDASANAVGIGTSTPLGKLQVVGDEVRIGSGGTLNNVTGNGDLYVQDGLEVDGELFLGGRISGGGLVDCDGAEDKLQYDATTEQFVCGSDLTSEFIFKTADETVTNQTYQDDDHLVVPVAANEDLILQYNLIISHAGLGGGLGSNGDGGIKVAFSMPSGATCNVTVGPYTNSGDSEGSTTCNGSADVAVVSGLSANRATLTAYAYIENGATAGDFVMRWAKVNPNGPIDTTVHSGSIVQIYRPGADLAELYGATDGAWVGDVVAFDPAVPAGVKKAAEAYSSAIAGVIATKPGQILGNADSLAGNAAQVPLALAGRVPVKTTTENGAIEPGDLLTASATIPGYAMKATEAGYTIGRALEGLASGDGLVSMFVETQYAVPDTIDVTGLASQVGVFGNDITELRDAMQAQGSLIADLQTLVGGEANSQALTLTGALTTPELNTQQVNANTLVVTGSADVGSLIVRGNASVGGNLVVTGTTEVQDLIVNGKIITAGETPEILAETAAGNGATVVIEGNDTTGTITLTAGATGITLGELAEVTFDEAFGNAPRVIISPANASAAGAGVFVQQSTVEPEGFTLSASATLLPSGEYQYNYIVIE